MDDFLDLFIYFDDALVKSLSTSILDGFIEIRTRKCIRDRTFSGRYHMDERFQIATTERFNKDYTKGFKSKHYYNDCNNFINKGNDGSLEDREFERVEEEIKRIYTSFSLHSQLLASLDSNNSLKRLTSNNISNLPSTINEGDYIQLKGDLSTKSLCCYLDSLITIFNCCGLDRLNSLIATDSPGFMDYTGILGMLSHLYEVLLSKNTQDMVMYNSNTPVVLTTNSNCFLDNSSHMFDKSDCPCNVFGKVVKVCNDTNCINLLRKSAQETFYQEFLNSIEPYLDILKANGILLPKKPLTNVEGASLLVVPISIYC